MGLYERIKDLAYEKKISIRKLEEDLGYGNGTIRRWNVSTPGVDKIKEIADYFNVSTDYILGRTEENLEDKIKDKNFYMIQRNAKKMTPEQRKKALRILEATFKDDSFWEN